MSIHLVLLGVVQYLCYVVFRDIHAQSLSKEAALEKIDARINELREAEAGAAGVFAAAAIEELKKLRADLEKATDDNLEHTVIEYLKALRSAAGTTTEKVGRGFETSLDKVWDGIESGVVMLDEQLQELLDRLGERKDNKDQAA